MLNIQHSVKTWRRAPICVQAGNESVDLEDAAINVMLDAAIQTDHRSQVFVDEARDTNLTTFGKATLTDRYLMPGENFQDLFARVASYYADDQAHAARLYD